MANIETLTATSQYMPFGITTIEAAMKAGRGSFQSFIGIVTDYMQPVQTRGTDVMMTVTLADASTGVDGGLRSRYFRLKEDLLPKVEIGDALIVKNIKMNVFQGEIQGLSTHQTEFICFRQASILSPKFRDRCMAQGQFMDYKASDGAAPPTIQEQQWIITLNAQLSGLLPTYPASVRTPVPLRTINMPEHVPAGTAVMEAHLSSGTPSPAVVTQISSTSIEPSLMSTASPRHQSKKFTWIEGIQMLDSRGVFVELAGEVLKMHTASDLELFLCDYTSNPILSQDPFRDLGRHELRPEHLPLEQGVLKIKLLSPHQEWAYRNLKEGAFVYLLNVRIKASEYGSEIEGNMWPDNYNRNKVGVMFLQDAEKLEVIKARKAALGVEEKKKFLEPQKAPTREVAVNSKAERNRRKKLKKRERLQEKRKSVQGPIKAGQQAAMSRAESTEGEDADSESPTKTMPNPKTTNPNVKCHYENHHLSTLHEVINNPMRKFRFSGDQDSELPFVNANHCVQIRVVDFYPHRIEQFATLVGAQWIWDFWLVVVSDERAKGPLQDATEAINVHVLGAAADDLLGQQAQDLDRVPQLKKKLVEKLFLLWGDLLDQKNNFLADNPGLEADEEFSALKCGIRADNRPFRACIAECGIPIVDRTRGGEDESMAVGNESEDEAYELGWDYEKKEFDPRMRWNRVYYLFGTEIV